MPPSGAFLPERPPIRTVFETFQYPTLSRTPTLLRNRLYPETMPFGSTLREVADAAGVHISTASRALNEATQSMVHPRTIKKVHEAAESLEYRPNPLARGLRTNRTMTVGMVISDIENSLFGPIIAGVEETIGRTGYSLLIAEAVPHDPEALPTVIDALVGRRVDGMILATTTRSGEHAERLKEWRVPVVLVNRVVEGTTVPAVVGDDSKGIALAVDHLVELGHTCIGHLAGPTTTSTGANRLDGFVARMEFHGLEHNDATISQASWFQLEPGYKAACELLARSNDFTAIVAATDLIALGAYRAIRERGSEVGIDISVTGYNDIAMMDLVYPSLTSIRIPYRRMGSEAGATLLGLIANNSEGVDEPLVTKMPPELVVRDSTRRIGSA